MLINFRFKNFKSFYEENQLSLQSVKDDELKEINTFSADPLFLIRMNLMSYWNQQ